MPKIFRSPAAAASSPPAHAEDASQVGHEPRNEYTVDELARVTNTTVRNVRAYQDRGLLAPPEKRGRVGVYDDTHVSRLKLVNHLLKRGYTLANIQDLIKAIDEGHDLRSILGLESAIGSPWSHERPHRYSLPELARLFGGRASPAMLSKAIELGLLERDGLSFVANNPSALSAGATMARAGIPAGELLDAVRAARPHFNAIAKVLVDLMVRQLDRYEAGDLPPPDDVPALVDTIWQVRPLGMVLVESEMNRAMEGASGDYLGERVAGIMEKLGRVQQSAAGGANGAGHSDATAGPGETHPGNGGHPPAED